MATPSIQPRILDSITSAGHVPLAVSDTDFSGDAYSLQHTPKNRSATDYKTVSLDKIERISQGLSLNDWSSSTPVSELKSVVVSYVTAARSHPPRSIAYRYFPHQTSGSLGTCVWFCGLGSNSAVDYELLETMAQFGYDVIGIDPLGSGLSDWLTDEKMSFLSAKSVREPIQDLDWLCGFYNTAIASILNTHSLTSQKLYLTGHSMGAMTVQLMAGHETISLVPHMSGLVTLSGFVTDGNVVRPPSYVSLVAGAPNFKTWGRLFAGLALPFERAATSVLARQFSSPKPNPQYISDIRERMIYAYSQSSDATWMQSRIAARKYYAELIKFSMKDTDTLNWIKDRDQCIIQPGTLFYFEDDPLNPAKRLMSTLDTLNPDFLHGELLGDVSANHLYPQQFPALTAQAVNQAIQDFSQP